MTPLEKFNNLLDVMRLWQLMERIPPGPSLEALSGLLIVEEDRFGYYEEKAQLLELCVARSQGRVARQREILEEVKADEELAAPASKVLENLTEFHGLLLDRQAVFERLRGTPPGSADKAAG